MVTITYEQRKYANDNQVKVGKRGVLNKIHKPSIIGKIYSKKKVLIEKFDSVLQGISEIKDLKKDDVFENDIDEAGNSLIEGFLEKIFISLKDADLINPILKFSLTDEKVRAGLIDITIELLKADVIPWYDIFVALKDSGLAIDVIRFLLTDPETRQGQIDLIVELIPRLIEEDVINLKDLLKHIPQIKIPEFKFEVPEGFKNLTSEQVLGSIEGLLHSSAKTLVFFNVTDETFHILPIASDTEEALPLIPETEMLSSIVWQVPTYTGTIQTLGPF